MENQYASNSFTFTKVSLIPYEKLTGTNTFRTKAREQQRQTRVADVCPTNYHQRSYYLATYYNEFLQLKETHQPSSSATVAQSGNPVAFVSTSASLGRWVLESGASDHMTGNKFILSNLSYYDSLPSVTVADDSKIKVQGFGQAHPLPNLSLDFTLYIPCCHFNLISIKMLTCTLDCSLLFIDNFVYV